MRGGEANGAGGAPAVRACDECLRRAQLLGHLASPLDARLRRRRLRLPALLALAEDELIAAAGGGGAAAESARRFADGLDLERVRERLERDGLGAACRHRGIYPAPLRELPDPPATLHFTGPAGRLAAMVAEPAVTVVGSRRPSPYGLQVAWELGRGLGAAGLTVVSGLALGIDAAVHRGVLDAGGSAIAVLASGADVPYPRTNRRLYARVREAGAVVSELPPGTPAFRWSFPARNRIMAALVPLTVVVEAAEGSGSLITATIAAELGRDVGAVPGQVTASKSAGANRLLREGACVIRGAEDVLDELLGVRAGPHPSVESQAWQEVGSRRVQPERAHERADDAARRRLFGARGPSAPELDPELRAVLEAVEEGRTAGEISSATGLPARRVRAALARLELLGLTAQTGLSGYTRTGRKHLS